MEWLKQANQNHVTLVTFVVASLITIFFGWPAIRAISQARRRERILDTRSWETIIADLQPNWADRYFGAISVSTGWFDRVYGPRLLGWRAFDRALSFAMAYAVLTLMIGWVVFDVGNLGGVAFLPEGWTLLQRGGIFAGVIAVAGGAYVIWRNDAALQNRLNFAFQTRPKVMAWLKAYLRLTSERLALIAYGLLVIVAGVGAVAVYVTGAGAIAVAFAATVAVAFALPFPGVDGAVTKFKFLFAALILVWAYRAGTVVPDFPFFNLDFGVLDDGQRLILTISLLFMLLLPTLNAIADFLSVAATRHFLRRIAAKGLGAWGVLGGLALDILIAILCLALLLILMTQTLDLWANATPIPLPFDWRAYRDTLCGGDWRRGTMLWLMLITTLAPTALHLAVGLGAVFSHSAQVDRQIAAILTPARDTLQTTHARTKEKGDGARARMVLDPDSLHRLEDLLARKEVWARVATVTLFAVFMAALIWGVLTLAQRFALPHLCPAP